MIENKNLTYGDIIPYVDQGLVTEVAHPEKPTVKIFNYTPECQFDRKWDNVTLQCRGLIMDISTGEILARPLPKFFNYEEYIEMGGQIPTEDPIVTDKLDGSLGILYQLNGKMWIATRGSFTSDQAIWATDWWRNNMSDELYDNATTHLFEIIFDANRIVLKYDFEGLVYLGSVDTQTGVSNQTLEFPGIRNVEHYPFTSVEELAKLNLTNREGYVLFYEKADLRVKIKFEDYVRLHKIVTGLSEKGLWELLQEKGLDVSPQEVIQDVPDEFFAWMEFKLNKLKTDFLSIEEAANYQYKMVERLYPNDRKQQAIWITRMSAIPAVVFAMLNGKDYKKIIFKMIKPKGSNTFAINNDENKQ
jgi:hypothetical protein